MVPLRTKCYVDQQEESEVVRFSFAGDPSRFVIHVLVLPEFPPKDLVFSLARGALSLLPTRLIISTSGTPSWRM